MTPTRDRSTVGPQLDTGTGTLPTERPNIWESHTVPPIIDTGTAETPTERSDTLDGGDAFIPPLWF
jgi:hypothetical protein